MYFILCHGEKSITVTFDAYYEGSPVYDLSSYGSSCFEFGWITKRYVKVSDLSPSSLFFG
ncbi:hypothetical protein [Sulfurovum sp. TSL1]|uniref:hypothetical protein n=1 Tax=Sulfurovum sp. TSL1 TaxID=2826994 RepID=UPI001CC72A6F|nr:hypothetical protein [Sulfurovum sp. TSL1]GIT98979.1 hypothetical protein TSL1_18000 [Sulfurovum sp. TSL1]